MSDSFVTPWTIALQAHLSMGFSAQKYRSRLPFPSSGDLPNPGIRPMSPALAGGFFTTEPPGRTINKGGCTSTICMHYDHISKKLSQQKLLEIRNLVKE